MKKVLFIVNPVSGKLKARTAVFDVLNVLSSDDFTVTTALTRYRGHCKEMAASAMEKGYDMVVCCGGDGTLNEAISGLLEASPDHEHAMLPLGYIPCGSTNDFASTLGISSEPSEAAKAILEGRTRTLDIGRFGNGRYFSYIASLGAFTAASYNAPQDIKNVFGHFAYIIEGLRSMVDITPERLRINADGRIFTGNYIFASVSNTTSAGGLVKLSADEIDLNDGLFELMLVRFPGGPTDASNIIAGITTNDFSGGMFDFVKAKEVTFEYEESKDWTLDGEKASAIEKVTIKNLHSAVEIFV